MKRRLRTLWQWSWLATAPAALLFVAWLSGTWRQWRTFVADAAPGPFAADLHGLGADRAHHLARQLVRTVRPADLADVPEALQLRSIQLFVSDTERGKLASDLPYSGFQWADALLAYGDGLHRVELRHRGDSFVHWGHDKRSLRVRTDADDLFAGLRQFHLVVPKFPRHGDNHLAYRLAKRLLLVAPRCELVNVFVNGGLVGVQEFTEQLDEGTLRDHDRMPGDLYVGELALRDARPGTANRLFGLPLLWEKAAANNHYDLESRAPLQTLCAVLAEPMSEAAHARLGELLDLEAWGRFGAFELLAQASGCDDTRNWRLFWDPWRRRFEPVVQDPAGWAGHFGAAEPPVHLDVAPSRLHAWLLANGDFLAARRRALAAFFAGEAAAFLAEVEATAAKLQCALPHDPNLQPADEAEVLAAVARMPARIARVFAAVRAGHLHADGEAAWAGREHGLRLEVRGRIAADEVWLECAGEPPAAPVVQVSVAHADGLHTVDLSAGLAWQGQVLRVPLRAVGQLVPRLAAGPADGARAVQPATFDLHLAGGLVPAAVRGVALRRGDDLVAVPRVGALAVHRHDSLFAAAPVPRPRAPQRWAGEVVIDGVRAIADDVQIAPGTTVRLGPKACLLFHGRVEALGAVDAPIRFLPAHPDQDPWGTVALDGPHCRGSVLQHCEFRGGSGHKEPLAEYCSMVSVHGCREIRVADCLFADNHQYDDLVHVMYADVVFERVTLVAARADALDCDISTVVIRDSAFVRSGNDGVDLMTTQALVENCRFDGNGDKGISIGEGSRLIALRCTFDGCNKAMEAKDGSVAHVLHCDLRRCAKAANAYKKNWRYDAGGTLVVHRSVLAGNGSLPTADTWSRIELLDCTVVGEPVAEYDQEYVDGTSTRMQNTARASDCDPGPQARRAAPEFPAELAGLRAVAGDAWRAAAGGTRGVAR